MGENKIERVVFVISTLASGGSERVMSELVNYAAGRGIEVYLILLSHDIREYEVDSRIHIIPLCDEIKKHGKVAAPWKRFSLLRKEFKNLNPDVVMSFLHDCNLYTTLAGQFLNIPVVISERNDPRRSPNSRLKRAARRTIYPLADGFIFQTEEAKSFFSGKIQEKSCVIANPIKRNLPFANRENTTKGIYAAGRLEKQKNYPMMISAFKNVHEKHPEYKLHIFGRGQLLDVLKKLSSELSLENSIVFEGVAFDLHDRIKSGAMFVLSSDYEGMPNALMEAMAMGLPCISTDCPSGGPRRLISDGVNGLLVPVDNEVALSDAMEKIISDKEFADKLSERAKEIREDFSLENIAGKYFEYLNGLI